MSECKTSVDVKYCKDHHEADEYGAGALQCDEDTVEGRAGWVYLRLPADNEKGYVEGGALHIRPQGESAPLGMNSPSWEFTGDPTKPETFTIHPSVHLRGTVARMAS